MKTTKKEVYVPGYIIFKVLIKINYKYVGNVCNTKYITSVNICELNFIIFDSNFGLVYYDGKFLDDYLGIFRKNNTTTKENGECTFKSLSITFKQRDLNFKFILNSLSYVISPHIYHMFKCAFQHK